MITLNTLHSIKGVNCIFVRDVIGTAPSDKYTQQKQGAYEVWYEETTLNEYRQREKGAKIFGLWQTLIASNLVDPEAVLQVIYTNTTQDYGFYLYRDEQTVQSGTVFGVELQALPAAASSKGITVNDAKVIEATPESLILPSLTLQTKREKAIAAHAKQKASKQRNILVIGSLLALALVADTALSYKHSLYMDGFHKHQARLNRFKNELHSLSMNKLIQVPNQINTLQNIYQVADKLSGQHLKAEIDMKPYTRSSIEVKFNASGVIPMKQLKSMGFNIVQTGSDTSLIEWVKND